MCIRFRDLVASITQFRTDFRSMQENISQVSERTHEGYELLLEVTNRLDNLEMAQRMTDVEQNIASIDQRLRHYEARTKDPDFVLIGAPSAL